MKTILSGTTDNSREAEAKTVAQGIGNAVAERQIEGAISTTKGYATDLIKPAGSAIRDVYQGVAGIISKKQRGDRGRVENLGKALLATATDVVRIPGNAALGVVGGVDNLYRKNVQDAINELMAGSIDRIPLMGKAVGNLARLSVMIPGLVPRTLNMLTKVADMPLNWAHKNTRMSGREAYNPELRGAGSYN